MNVWLRRGLLGLILVTAVSLRLTGVDWDGYHHYHPDERYIAWVATTIERPSEWQTALSPTESTINPFYWPPDASSLGIAVLQDQSRKFAYGHVPLYLGVAATRVIEWVGPFWRPYLPPDWWVTSDLLNGEGYIEYWHLTAVARALTGLVDTGTVLLVFLLGRRLYGAAVGLLAAAFLAVNVMHIQLAHFFAVDPYLTFFATAAVYFMVVYADNGRGQAADERETMAASPHSRFVSIPLWLAAVCVGLAVGSKFAAVLLMVPLALVVWMRSEERWLFWQMVTTMGVAFLAFALTNPFALLDLNCTVITPAFDVGPIHVPMLNWRSCYLENVTTQGAMVRGTSDLPFTRQYTGTLPYLYYLEMQLRWGMGPLLGVVAFAGLGWVIGRLIRTQWRQRRAVNGRWRWAALVESPVAITLLWILPYFVTTGSFFVKFMRYLQPMVPFLMIYGAAMVWQWQHKLGRRLVIGGVLGVTGLYAVSFVNMYHQPHPWVAASEWIFRNVPPGSVILSEEWDDALPSTIMVDGEYRQRNDYLNAPLTWHTGTEEQDDAHKLASNLSLLAYGEYLTIVSNRVYGVDPRLPQRYPISSQYHQLLFDGALGYELVFVANRSPVLFGLHIQPDTFGWPGLQPPAPVAAHLAAQPGFSGGRADESFIVYDQPLTMIFRNTGRLTADEMRQLFALEGADDQSDEIR